MEEIPSDHEAFVRTAETPVQRQNHKRFLLAAGVLAGVVASVCVITARMKSHAARVNTDAAMQLIEHNPHGVCAPPAEHFDQKQMGCPTDRTDSCVAGNRDYLNFTDAWKACGRVPECGAIMRWTSGNYYLRRRDDPVVDIPGAWSMFYTCGGSGETPASTITVQNAHCQPPIGGFEHEPRGCKGSFPEGCVGGRNLNFRTLAEAWEACGITPGCDTIMRWTTQGRYYLRRFDDPKLEKAGAASIRYSC